MKKYMALGLTLAVLTTCGKDEPKDIPAGDLDISAAVYAVCGNSQILGTREEGFSSGSCGIKNPVKVYAVSGVKLSTPATINCEAAQQLNAWVKNVASPSARDIDRKLSKLEIFASYSCRTRNHRKGAKLSEHSYGNAIDIGGFYFTDGSHASVLSDYRSSSFGGFMKSVRAGACGPFGTVLGPGSDALHKNHFHFDVARYDNGNYCK